MGAEISTGNSTIGLRWKEVAFRDTGCALLLGELLDESVGVESSSKSPSLVPGMAASRYTGFALPTGELSDEGVGVELSTESPVLVLEMGGVAP